MVPFCSHTPGGIPCRCSSALTSVFLPAFVHVCLRVSALMGPRGSGSLGLLPVPLVAVQAGLLGPARPVLDPATSAACLLRLREYRARVAIARSCPLCLVVWLRFWVLGYCPFRFCQLYDLSSCWELVLWPPAIRFSTCFLCRDCRVLFPFCTRLLVVSYSASLSCGGVVPCLPRDRPSFIRLLISGSRSLLRKMCPSSVVLLSSLLCIGASNPFAEPSGVALGSVADRRLGLKSCLCARQAACDHRDAP